MAEPSLVEGIPYAKVKHLAEEARSLHANNLKDNPPPKGLQEFKLSQEWYTVGRKRLLEE